MNDSFARFMKILTLAGAAFTIMLSFDYMKRERLARFEYPVLILLSTAGMMLTISANDLISLYLALEFQSLALYVLAAFRRDKLRSTEAGLKYFVLGALSSGLLLYGSSLIYGYTGATLFPQIAEAVRAHGAPIGFIFGLVFVLAGLAFKISAVPFHMWTPDVYEGSPTPVTAYFAAAAKMSAMAMVHPHHPRRFPKRRRSMAADHYCDLGCLDGARRVRRHRAAEHQAAARLFVHRPCRIRADRPRRGNAGRRCRSRAYRAC